MKYQNIQQTIWLARHGNRLDFVTPEWFNSAKFPYDPPLSEDGILQAMELAQKLKHENVKFIYSSPYLRAIQTAYYAAKVLSTSIKIEAGLGEWQNLEWMSVAPELNPLEITAQKYGCLDLTYASKVLPRYPETEEDLGHRLDSTIKHILSECSADVLIIGHSVTVKEIISSLLRTRPTFKPTLCCLIKLVRQNDNWQMLFY